MTSVFLPLRSNCTWFTNADTHERLACRVKNLLLFYDNIQVEDGRYDASFVSNGSSDHYTVPAEIRDRSSVTYYTPGSAYSVGIAPVGSPNAHQLLGGQLEAAYEVDFWPLFSEAGIVEANFIEWVDIELTDEGERLARQASHLARADPEIGSGLPENRFLRSKVIDSLHKDALLASGLGVPFSADSHAATVIDRSNAMVASRWSSDVTAMLQNAWVKLGFPDAGTETWDVVLRARESAAGADLRRTMDKLANLAVTALTGDASALEWEDEAKRLLAQELAAELLHRTTGLKDLSVNFGLNFVPYAGTAISTAADLRRFVIDRRSWISLIGGLT